MMIDHDGRDNDDDHHRVDKKKNDKFDAFDIIHH